MNNTKVEYCKDTSKYCYSSEAKATRALNRYEDIKRVYLCDFCGKWHTTSLSYESAVEQGVIEPNKYKKPPSKKEIQKQIDKLTKKINKNG